MSNQSFGKEGEQAAEKFLLGQGYKILARNFRTRFGEIDIIAKDGDCLVFAEVKARSGSGYGLPEEAVTAAKQRHLIAASQIYLSQKKMHHFLWRIDVLALTPSRHPRESGDPRQNENGGFEIRHLKNAVSG
jgi:putative endonuclease